jgi:hypothetical protein
MMQYEKKGMILNSWAMAKETRRSVAQGDVENAARAAILSAQWYFAANPMECEP